MEDPIQSDPQSRKMMKTVADGVVQRRVLRDGVVAVGKQPGMFVRHHHEILTGTRIRLSVSRSRAFSGGSARPPSPTE
jgi:hypothetical protein